MTQLIAGPGPRLQPRRRRLRRAGPRGARRARDAAITACQERGKYVGICGQGPSDHPDLAAWLVEQGIESMSLNPDTVVDTWLHLAKAAKSGS